MIAQKLWAIENGYNIFGESPSVDENYGYDEFGVPPIAINPYNSRGVITSHASFMFPFDTAMDNLRVMSLLYPGSYTPYGFASAVNTNNNEVIKLYRPLEQGMIVPALANLLSDNAVQEMFLAGLDKERIMSFLEKDKPLFTTFDVVREMTDLYWNGKKMFDEGKLQEADVAFQYMDFLDTVYNLDFNYQNWQKLYGNIRQAAEQNLSRLYQQAIGEIEQGKYRNAIGYLKSIIAFDVDYKDSAKLYETYRQLLGRQ